MTDERNDHGPEHPDTPLGHELRGRAPAAGAGYWEAIEARLVEAEAAETGDPDTNTTGVRLTPMNEPLPSPTAVTPAISTVARTRLLAAAAAVVLIVGVVAVQARTSDDTTAVTAADGPATSGTPTAETNPPPTVAESDEAIAPTTLPTTTELDPADDRAATTTLAPDDTTPPTTATENTVPPPSTTGAAATTIPPTTTGAPSTTSPPTTSPPTTTNPNPTMPNVVGLTSIEAASAAISDACGVNTISFPSPAWDPENPVGEGTVMATWPSAGSEMVRTESGCAAPNGATITIFYANQAYCSGPDDPVGLGYCPVQGDVPPEPHGDGDTSGTETPSTTSIPATTIPTTTVPLETAMMPDVRGAESQAAANAMIAAACGVSLERVWTFPSPAWDPSSPHAQGTVLGSLPAAGGTIYSNGDECFGNDSGASITIFAADSAYCSGPSDPVGLGWCPKN